MSSGRDIFITTRCFTRDAEAFARDCQQELVRRELRWQRIWGIQARSDLAPPFRARSLRLSAKNERRGFFKTAALDISCQSPLNPFSISPYDG